MWPLNEWLLNVWCQHLSDSEEVDFSFYILNLEIWYSKSSSLHVLCTIITLRIIIGSPAIRHWDHFHEMISRICAHWKLLDEMFQLKNSNKVLSCRKFYLRNLNFFVCFVFAPYVSFFIMQMAFYLQVFRCMGKFLCCSIGRFPHCFLRT